MSCKDPKDERAEFCLYGHNMIPNPKKGAVEFSFASGSELCTYWSQIYWIETDECIPPIQYLMWQQVKYEVLVIVFSERYWTLNQNPLKFHLVVWIRIIN